MREISIQEQKQLLLKMMADIDSFCTNNKIRYFLTSGSLLGAVRHKGFIPWDDDIDITMPRKDYERFIKTYTSSEPFQIICKSNNPNYYLQFAKVIATNTVLNEPVATNFPLGVYIDIFPLDNMSDDYRTAVSFFQENEKDKQKLMIKNLKPIPERDWWKNIIISIIKPFIFASRDTLIEQIDKRSRRYESETFTKYVGITCSGIYGENEIMESAWYDDSILYPFEEYVFRIPVGYDCILSKLYGNYMELPPENKRKSHHMYKAYYK